MRYTRRGSNQYRRKTNLHYITYYFGFVLVLILWGLFSQPTKQANAEIISPLPATTSVQRAIEVAPSSASLTQEETNPEQEKQELIKEPTELEEIVAYITRVFEPEGKDVVVRAINCFYSESGLIEDAFNQNTDGPKSQDHGVAQLNSFYHDLTEEEKTEYKANIDRAYKIYKGRGNSFSAWYGKLCN